MLKNYLITSLTSCENLKLIKPGVLNPDLALLFIPLWVRLLEGSRRGSNVSAEAKAAKREPTDVRKVCESGGKDVLAGGYLLSHSDHVFNIAEPSR